MPVHPHLGCQRVRVAAWLILTALGAAYAWTALNDVNPDGISYLDIADAYGRGDWHMALNRYWSPLYPALIAVVSKMLRPASIWELPTVHLLNFVIFLGALASFEFFLTQLVRYHRSPDAMPSSTPAGLPEWALRIFGYTVFAHTSLVLIGPILTPDMCVSAIVYLASGLLLKIALRPEVKFDFLLLGTVLGAGYLAKAPMFPLAFVFLVLAAITVYRRSSPFEGSLRVLAGLLGFAVFAGILVGAYFATYGRLMLGDSGTLNYAWRVDRLPYIHWQGGFPGSGIPVHPTREVLSAPPVYEFATPVGGTYPPWYDPAYWYEGVKVHFDARGQELTLVRNAGVIVLGILEPEASVAVAGVALLFLESGWAVFLRRLPAYYILLALPAAAFGMFSLVHLEERFVAAFVTLFWLSLFAAIPWPGSDLHHRILKVLFAAMIGVLAIFTFVSPNTQSSLTMQALRGKSAPAQWSVAQGLHAIGVQRGDRVGFIGYSFDASWARLAKVKIVAEMPACVITRYSRSCLDGQPDGVAAFLAADEATRARIFQAFSQAGAKVIVMRLRRPVPLGGWQRISGTDYYVHALRE